MSLAELAQSPTAPTVSRALEQAAQDAQDGPIPAITRAVHGSTNPDDYAAVASPAHVIAWGVALITAARLIDPAIRPDGQQIPTWDAGRFASMVGGAHRALTAWAGEHTRAQLSGLFLAAADKAREEETDGR